MYNDAFDRYYYRSGRNSRRRNDEERRNIRKIALFALAMSAIGFAFGGLLVLLLNG